MSRILFIKCDFSFHYYCHGDKQTKSNSCKQNVQQEESSWKKVYSDEVDLAVEGHHKKGYQSVHHSEEAAHLPQLVPLYYLGGDGSSRGVGSPEHEVNQREHIELPVIDDETHGDVGYHLRDSAQVANHFVTKFQHFVADEDSDCSTDSDCDQFIGTVQSELNLHHSELPPREQHQHCVLAVRWKLQRAALRTPTTKATVGCSRDVF
uniref:Uncharacterized protein n=1 Tax=Clastoptera arizonana TaxID=38151 RepID=A0A1B6DNI9_9HEMI